MEAGGNGYAMDADILGVRGGAERPRESARVGIACKNAWIGHWSRAPSSLVPCQIVVRRRCVVTQVKRTPDENAHRARQAAS